MQYAAETLRCSTCNRMGLTASVLDGTPVGICRACGALLELAVSFGRRSIPGGFRTTADVKLSGGTT